MDESQEGTVILEAISEGVEGDSLEDTVDLEVTPAAEEVTARDLLLHSRP